MMGLPRVRPMLLSMPASMVHVSTTVHNHDVFDKIYDTM